MQKKRIGHLKQPALFNHVKIVEHLKQYFFCFIESKFAELEVHCDMIFVRLEKSCLADNEI